MVRHIAYTVIPVQLAFITPGLELTLVACRRGVAEDGGICHTDEHIVSIEESFMQGARGWLNELKLRASYGNVGNQSGIDRYDGALLYNMSSTGGNLIGGQLTTLYSSDSPEANRNLSGCSSFCSTNPSAGGK